MYIYYILFIIFAFLTNTQSFSQDIKHSCSTSYAPMPQRDIETYLNSMSQVSRNSISKDSITIPIVIHNLTWNHNGYLSDNFITDFIAKTNDGLANRGASFVQNGVDAKIRLCLANVDPDGKPTSGIIHKEHYMGIGEAYITDFYDRNQSWDPDRYLNIYLTDGASGFTYFPWSIFSNFGGIAVSTKYIQEGAGLTILLHEIGHYLGLYHTFEDHGILNGKCVNVRCMINGDMVCDTPPDQIGFDACFEVNSCDTDIGVLEDSLNLFISDTLDMNDNYMDGGICRFRFTQGQINRMHWALQEYRSELIGGDSLCKNCLPFSVDFEIPKHHLILGETIDLESLTNASNYTYNWYVDNELSHTGIVFDFTPSEVGTNKIKLEVFNNEDDNCQEPWTMEKLISTRCADAHLEFYRPDEIVKDSVYSLEITGIENLHWSYLDQEGITNKIEFYSNQSGLVKIEIQYSLGLCQFIDSLFVVVFDNDNRKRKYFIEDLGTPDDSLCAPTIVNIKKRNSGEYFLQGYSNCKEDQIDFNDIDTTQDFMRRYIPEANFIEQWEYTNEVDTIGINPVGNFLNQLQLIPDDFVFDEDGSMYCLAVESYSLNRTDDIDSPILYKVDATGRPIWCKRLNIPSKYVWWYSRDALELRIIDDKLYLIISNTIVLMDKKGNLLEAFKMVQTPENQNYRGFGGPQFEMLLEKDQLFFTAPYFNTYPEHFIQYSNSLSSSYRSYLIIGNINLLTKKFNFSAYDAENKAIFRKSMKVKKLDDDYYIYFFEDHENGLVHNILKTIKSGEIYNHRSYFDSTPEDRGLSQRKTDAGIISLNNGTTVALSSVQLGKRLGMLKFDKEGSLFEHHHFNIPEHPEQTNYISVSRWANEAMSLASDGFLYASNRDRDRNDRLTLKHLPLDSIYLQCEKVYPEIFEVDSVLVPFQEEIQLTTKPIDIKVEEIELIHKRSFWQNKTICENEHELFDYSITQVDTTYACPDQIIYELKICRNAIQSPSNINLFVFEQSPLLNETVEVDRLAIEFNDSLCTILNYTSTVSDQKHFMLNTKENYATPYTLHRDFFDAAVTLEYNYLNNFIDSEIKPCDELVTNKNLISENSINVYPNPANDLVNITSQSVHLKSIEIYNALGQLSQKIQLKQVQEYSLDVQDFFSGIYIFKIFTEDNRSYNKKLFIN